MWRSLKTWGGALAVSVLSISPVAAQHDAIPVRTRVVADVDVEVAGDDADEAKKASESEYWIGIALAPLPELAKQQLSLEHGVVVEDVAADGPAAKAEVKKHDILIKVDDTPVKEPADLIKVVEGAKDKELRIVIVRGGKDMTVQVVPTKRPQAKDVTARWHLQAKPEFRAEIKGLEQALEALKNKAGGEGFSFLMPGPAVVTPHRLEMQLKKPGEFPKNLTVKISKEGDHPAKIHVKRDEKEWDVTEDKLSELPEDVRDHVKQFLGKPVGPNLQLRSSIGGAKTYRLNPDSKVAGELKVWPVPQRVLDAKLDPFGVEGKLNEIMKEIKELRKEVDDLKRPGEGKSSR